MKELRRPAALARAAKTQRSPRHTANYPPSLHPPPSSTGPPPCAMDRRWRLRRRERPRRRRARAAPHEARALPWPAPGSAPSQRQRQRPAWRSRRRRDHRGMDRELLPRPRGGGSGGCGATRLVAGGMGGVGGRCALRSRAEVTRPALCAVCARGWAHTARNALERRVVFCTANKSALTLFPSPLPKHALATHARHAHHGPSQTEILRPGDGDPARRHTGESVVPNAERCPPPQNGAAVGAARAPLAPAMARRQNMKCSASVGKEVDQGRGRKCEAESSKRERVRLRTATASLARHHLIRPPTPAPPTL